MGNEYKLGCIQFVMARVHPRLAALIGSPILSNLASSHDVSTGHAGRSRRTHADHHEPPAPPRPALVVRHRQLSRTAFAHSRDTLRWLLGALGRRCRVRVTEVSDDAWSSASSDAGSDVDSVLSDSDLQLDAYDPSQETFAERIAALKDMVSPSTRAAISDAASSTKGWLRWSVAKAGNAAWIVTTSALLVGLPLLLSIEGEAAIVQQEKEFAAQVRSRPASPLAESFSNALGETAGAPSPRCMRSTGSSGHKADDSFPQPGANPYGAPPAGSFPGQPAPQAGSAPQGIVPAGF